LRLPLRKPAGTRNTPIPPRDQQVERAAHEIRVGALLLVELVGVLAGHRAPLAVRRVRDDEADRAAHARRLLADPPLEGHVVEVDVGAQRAEQRRADLRVFDGGPVDALDLAAGLERQAEARAEPADEPPDASARLERVHHTVGARELGEQRAQRLRERLGDPRWRVILVDQPEGLGDELGRELALHLLDREATPAGVAREDLSFGGGEVAGLLAQDHPHRLQVGLAPPGDAAQIGLHFLGLVGGHGRTREGACAGPERHRVAVDPRA
jgi:hypothetical protein